MADRGARKSRTRNDLTGLVQRAVSGTAMIRGIFCEEAFVVVIVSMKYDCSQGRIKCQSYCDPLPSSRAAVINI